MHVFLSYGCTNSQRFIAAINRIPSLKASLQIINVDSMPPEQRKLVQYVPTLVDDHNRQHIGTAAFEFLKPYEGEIDLDPAPMGGGGLAFGSLRGDDDGVDGMQYVEGFGDFTKPPM